MSFESIQAGLSSAWSQVSSAACAAATQVGEFFSTYVPVVETHAVALATLFNSNVTAPAVAQATSLVAPLGVAGPCIWLLPLSGAALLSMKIQSLGDDASNPVAQVALRVTGFAFAVVAGASAAIFMGSFLGVATALGIAATYGTGLLVTFVATMLRI